METSIVRRPAGSDCAAILRALPDWFGKAAANEALARQAQTGLTFVAELAGRPVGLTTLRDTGFSALEIELLAVLPEMHGRGIGRRLVLSADGEARCLGKAYLLVRTLGPSRPSNHYARTRRFYDRSGFLALEESLEVWGPDNPCLFMIRPIDPC